MFEKIRRKLFPTLREKVEINPRKYLGRYMKSVIGKYGYIDNIQGNGTIYGVWIINGITDWVDVVREREIKERVNLKVVKNPDGSIKYNRVMSPFSGRFYDVAAHTCEAIPLSIRSFTPIETAPNDLIDTLMDNLDYYVNEEKRIEKRTRV